MDNTPEKLDFKRVLPIFVIVLVDLLGLTIIIPLLPLYATKYGASPLFIGVLSAVYPVMQFIAAPTLGSLSDRYGRKPILLVSQIGTLIGFILLGFVNGLPLLFVSRFIDGVSGGNISTAQAAISDSTSEKTRTQAMGLIGAAFGLGFTIGPVIAFAALAMSGNNYQLPAFIAAGFSMLSILLTAFWFKETLPAERRSVHGANRTGLSAMTQALGLPVIGFLLALMFLQQAVFGGFESLFALFTLSRLGMNASGNALLFLFVGIILVVVQGGLIRTWSHKFGDRWLILLGLSMLAIGLILSSLTPQQPMPGYSQGALMNELQAGTNKTQVSLPPDGNNGWLGLAWILVALIPTSIGGAVLSSTINSLISKNANKNEVGKMLGMSSAFSSAANALAPLVGGALFQWLGTTAPFLLGGILMAVLYVFARSRVTPDKPTLATA